MKFYPEGGSWMENFIFSLNATFPIFIVMVIGWILKQKGFVTENFCNVSDKLVFRLCLPASLLLDIMAIDLKNDFDLNFVLFCMFGTIFMFLVVWIMALCIIRDRSIIGAFSQGACRGSAAILGVAFVTNIYGEGQLGLVPMMIAASVPFFNIFAVLMLSVGAQEDIEKESLGKTLKKVCKNIATNPIIIAIMVGLLTNLAGLKLPIMAQKTIGNFGALSTPLAVLSLGASFRGREAVKKIGPTMAAVIIKLFVLPAVLLPIAIELGFRGSEMVAVLIMAGAPTTPSSYIMAKEMHNDSVLSSSIIVVSNLLSAISITLWIFLLKSGGLI